VAEPMAADGPAALERPARWLSEHRLFPHGTLRAPLGEGRLDRLDLFRGNAVRS